MHGACLGQLMDASKYCAAVLLLALHQQGPAPASASLLELWRQRVLKDAIMFDVGLDMIEIRGMQFSWCNMQWYDACFDVE